MWKLTPFTGSGGARGWWCLWEVLGPTTSGNLGQAEEVSVYSNRLKLLHSVLLTNILNQMKMHLELNSSHSGEQIK